MAVTVFTGLVIRHGEVFAANKSSEPKPPTDLIHNLRQERPLLVHDRLCALFCSCCHSLIVSLLNLIMLRTVFSRVGARVATGTRSISASAPARLDFEFNDDQKVHFPDENLNNAQFSMLFEPPTYNFAA